MPSVLIYLLVMLGIILCWFMLLKRPIYEAVFVAFLVLLTISGSWPHVWIYAEKSLSNSILYSMTTFVAMSIILTKTKVIDGCIGIILALLGRFPGGAGYVSVIASAFMGALSGSGPGNVMATGSITIPAMIKTGFPPELAGNIESHASSMGNMIPPSSNIIAAMGVYMALYPNAELSSGQFWILLWGCSIWFILQRLLMLWGFCKYYKIQPMDEADIPSLKETFRENWQGLLLPVIILLPFLLDYLFKDTFFTERLGAQGAKYFSSSALLYIPGIAAIYGCLIAKDRTQISPSAIAGMLAKSVKSIAPAVSVCVFGYMIAEMFNDMNVAEEMGLFIQTLKFGKFCMVVFAVAISCVLGMVLPGSTVTLIFGAVFITTLNSVGVPPLLTAAMLPCLSGVMGLVTPPLALCMYAGMSISGADFEKTFVNNLWWVAGQFVMEVVVLMGWLPVLGM